MTRQSPNRINKKKDIDDFIVPVVLISFILFWAIIIMIDVTNNIPNDEEKYCLKQFSDIICEENNSTTSLVFNSRFSCVNKQWTREKGNKEELTHYYFSETEKQKCLGETK